MTAPTTTRATTRTRGPGEALDDEPAGLASAIVGLLRVLPPPDGPDVDDTARAVWFARNAALLDAIALAAAHPTLAADAAQLARRARATARTYLTFSTTSTSPTGCTGAAAAEETR